MIVEPVFQKTILFTDWRHIRCSDLSWASPEGAALPLSRPPAPMVDAMPVMGQQPRGIRLIAQPAVKGAPLVFVNSIDFYIGRVIYDGGMYRSWRLEAEYPPEKGSVTPVSVTIAYAESKDGIEWKEATRSALNVPGQRFFGTFTFFIDPAGPPEERYKAVYMASPPIDEQKAIWQKHYADLHPRYRDERVSANRFPCLYSAISSDGLHWRAIPEPLMIHKSDTDTTVYYDQWLKRYVMYTRLYRQERRWIGRAEAEDFRHWGPVQPLIWPDLNRSPSDDIYWNARSEYPGLPAYHLMFPMVYHRDTQASDVDLYASADGICWNRVPGSPVLSPGEPGQWDSEFIYIKKDLVPFGSDRIAVPYCGTPFPHKYPRWPEVLKAGRTAWAWWPKGRLCAVRAENEGEFFTFPIVPAGRTLRMNIRTRRAGEIRVGLEGVAGRSAADCIPLTGNSLSMQVCWKDGTDISVPEGQPVTLYFKLRSAELFGVEWI